MYYFNYWKMRSRISAAGLNYEENVPYDYRIKLRESHLRKGEIDPLFTGRACVRLENGVLVPAVDCFAADDEEAKDYALDR